MMKPFNQYHNEYTTKKSIGFFPGGFKPPHAGHFAALQSMLGFDVKNPETGSSILLGDAMVSDHVYVIIGHAPRGSLDQNTSYNKMKKTKDVEGLQAMSSGMITKEMSKQIWELYMNQGDKNIASKSTVMISPAASPIIGMESLILNLKSEQIANNVLNLYAGQEDQERYKYFTSDKFRAKLAEHKDIDINKIKIKANMIDRLGSATDARSQILRVASQEADIETLKKYIPAGVNINDYLNLLKTFK